MEIQEIDDADECQAKEHDLIAGHMDDDAHDDRSKADSQIRNRRQSSHGRTRRRSFTIKYVGHQRRHRKSIPHPPDHRNKNKHGKGLREGEEPHRNDISDETRQNDGFSLIEIQNVPAHCTTQKEHEGDRGKEKAWIVDPMFYRIKREKSGQGSPREEGNGIGDGRPNRFWTEKETVPSGSSLQGGSLFPCQLIRNQERAKRQTQTDQKEHGETEMVDKEHSYGRC